MDKFSNFFLKHKNFKESFLLFFKFVETVYTWGICDIFILENYIRKTSFLFFWVLGISVSVFIGNFFASKGLNK